MNLTERDSEINCDKLSPSLINFRKQVFYQEVISLGSETFVRCFSYNQTQEKSKTGETLLRTKLHTNNFFRCNKGNLQRATSAMKAICNSNNSQSTQTEIMKSANVFESTITNAAKKYLKSFFKCCVFFAAIGILTFYITNDQRYTKWNLKQTSKLLTENVFGQTEAIGKLNSTLHIFNNTNIFITMVFTGGTGVGKTLTSSIINHNFPWTSKKFISKLNEKELPIFLSEAPLKFEPHLIQIDDLQIDNIDEAIHFALFTRAKMKHTKVLLIFIFTTHKNGEGEEIFSKFRYAELNSVHIPFVNLSKNVVEKCYHTEIQKQGVNISEEELEKLIKNKMKDIDIVNGPVGCKGVSEEVSFYKN